MHAPLPFFVNSHNKDWTKPGGLTSDNIHQPCPDYFIRKKVTPVEGRHVGPKEMYR